MRFFGKMAAFLGLASMFGFNQKDFENLPAKPAPLSKQMIKRGFENGFHIQPVVTKKEHKAKKAARRVQKESRRINRR